MPERRYASDFPLPGGVEQYFESLVELLRAVQRGSDTKEELSAWIRQHYEGASGETAISGYVSSLLRQGFCRLEQDRLVLTKRGLSVLDAAGQDRVKACRIVLDTKRELIAGYEALLGSLSEGPQSFDQVDTAIQEALGVTWQSKNQTMFRMNWMRSLGYVARQVHEYELTESGRAVVSELGLTRPQPPEEPPSEPPTGPQEDDPVLVAANRLGAQIMESSTAGGRGDELEQSVGDAFEFLGFETQIMGGSGNPDVIVDAPVGQASYRVIVEAKSRSGGHVQQNDVNFDALLAQKTNSGADYAVVVGPAFSSPNLQTWATDKRVRLVRAEELKQLLLAHAVCPIPLDAFVPFFRGGGLTDDGILAALVAESENTSQMMQVAREVYRAVHEHQESDAAIDVNSLFFILGRNYSVDMVQAAVAFLRSEVIGALGVSDSGGLFTRLAPSALSLHLDRLKQTLAD